MSRIFNRVLNQRLANHGLRIVRLEDAHGAQLGAIFARLDALHTRIAALETDVERLQEARAADNGLMSALFTRLTALESARIAAPVAPESAVTASGVPQEPGNATERYGGDPIDFYDPQLWTAIAAHIHRPFGGYPYDTANADHCTLMAEIVCEAIAFIQRDEDNAWLKEGEA